MTSKQEHNRLYLEKNRTAINAKHRERYATDQTHALKSKIYQVKKRLENGGSVKRSTLIKYGLLIKKSRQTTIENLCEFY